MIFYNFIIINLKNKMNFSKQLEYHKIPEWYNQYFDYEMLKGSVY